MRYGLILLWILFWPASAAMAQVSIGIALPGVSIGINQPVYPELVRVPGYPVYYAPQLDSNFFFYDGMYWVYQGDNWYASTWYDGPWKLVDPYYVPLFVLRVPVRYYRHPPEYFRGWRENAAPRWGEHWGNEWEQRRRGWDRWNRNAVPAPAPLPVYQRNYSGDRYPRAEQQQSINRRNYRYQPRDAVARQHYQDQAVQRAPAPFERGQQGPPQERSYRPQETQRPNAPSPQQPSRPAVPSAQPPQRGGEFEHSRAATQAPPQQRAPAVQNQTRRPQPGPLQRGQQAPPPGHEGAAQGKGAPPERGRAPAHDRARNNADEPRP